MAVSGVGTTTTTTKSSQQVKEFKSNLDKDSFLNILVTQLRNQNPLQPMNDTEFIGQMAQFSSLEQMQNTNAAIKLNSANNMVNKLITASYKDEGSYTSRELTGVVTKIAVKNSDVYLTVDENGTNREIKFHSIP
jgi:flagellar basal-body rod modification protein FlgD